MCLKVVVGIFDLNGQRDTEAEPGALLCKNGLGIIFFSLIGYCDRLVRFPYYSLHLQADNSGGVGKNRCLPTVYIP